ncbi:alpha/beta hydrolase family protein [Pseudoduganella sp.]|uniref:alpha/beta hydrolase family protein n=1 Tax=Pseudoduganella sp. TaxID=1880898 RepID=UPI0035AE6C72
MRYLTLAACLAALPCFAQNTPVPTTPAQIPAATFAARDQFYNPNMSPDGKHLAVTIRMPIGKRLVPTINVFSLPDMKLESTVRMDGFEVPSYYDWVSNTRLAVGKALLVGSREAPQSTGEVMAMEFDGSKQQYVFGYDMFRYSHAHHDDQAFGYVSGTPWPQNNHILLTSHPWRTERTILIDIDTVKNSSRKERASLPYKDLSFVSQPDGSPRFAYGVRDDTSFFLLRSDDGSKWNEVEQEKIGDYLRPIRISADNSEFTAWHAKNGQPASVVKENLATGERRVLAHDPNGSLALMSGVLRGQPIAVMSTIGKPQVSYFDDKSPEALLHKSLSEQFPGSIVNFVDFTTDGSKLIFSVSSDRDPGVYYLYDRASNKADLLLVSMEGIEPALMAERRPISFKARDGLQLHGYLTMPKHAPQQKVPLVLIPHGGPHGPYDEWFFDSDAQFLASRGYAVLQVNFRGSGGRGKAFETSGYRQWGGKIMDDLVDGVKWVSTQGEVDGNRACVFGASFGGYAALMLAAREPNLFKCAIGYAGVYDLPYIYKEDKSTTSRRTANWYKKFIGEDKEELERFSPVAQVAKIKAPVFLIHGGKDHIVSKEHAFRMRDALTAAGKAPEWMYIDYEGHGFYDTENATAVYEKLEAFLNRHIGKP